jgi:hypothetical protein
MDVVYTENETLPVLTPPPVSGSQRDVIDRNLETGIISQFLKDLEMLVELCPSAADDLAAAKSLCTTRIVGAPGRLMVRLPEYGSAVRLIGNILTDPNYCFAGYHIGVMELIVGLVML